MFRSVFATAGGTAVAAGLIVAAAPGSASPAAAQPASDTLIATRSRGTLLCGVAGQVAGFSLPDSKGEMRSLDADTCRTVAAAIFGDATKVPFVNATMQNRFTALRSGEVDMLCAAPSGRWAARRRLAWSSPRSTSTTARASW